MQTVAFPRHERDGLGLDPPTGLLLDRREPAPQLEVVRKREGEKDEKEGRRVDREPDGRPSWATVRGEALEARPQRGRRTPHHPLFRVSIETLRVTSKACGSLKRFRMVSRDTRRGTGPR